VISRNVKIMNIRICLDMCGRACIERGETRTDCLALLNAYVLAVDPDTSFRFTSCEP